MNIIKKLPIIFLAFAITFYSCKKKNGENEITCEINDIEMDIENYLPNKDWNNIENLYANPWTVLHKAVQGKWKLRRGYWHIDGFTRDSDIFMHISENRIMVSSDNKVSTNSNYIIKVINDIFIT